MTDRISKDSRGMGQALVGALLKGCLDRDIEPELNVHTRKLIKDNNRIIGVEIEENGEAKEVLPIEE